MKFKNTTDYPTPYLRRMLRWAMNEVGVPRSRVFKGVLREAKFTRCSRSYRGLASGGAILVRIGPRNYPWPVNVAWRAAYRAEGMTEWLLDRDAVLVNVTAHELAHIRLERIGKARNNEANAETIARGVTREYLANRARLEAEWGAGTERQPEPAPEPSPIIPEFGVADSTVEGTTAEASDTMLHAKGSYVLARNMLPRRSTFTGPDGPEELMATKKGKRNKAAVKQAASKKAKPVKTAAAKPSTKPAKAPVKVEAKPDAKRAGWKGLTMAKVIFYCGTRKWGYEKIRQVAEKLGFTPSRDSVYWYGLSGQRGEYPGGNNPTFTPEQKAGIDAVARNIPDEPAAKVKAAPKAAKAKGKAGKAKASNVARQAAADAEDDEDFGDPVGAGVGAGDEDDEYD